MKKIFLTFIIALSLTSWVFADSFSIEDPTLSELDQKVSSAIYSQRKEDADWLSSCSFVSKKIILDSEKNDYYFVTTKDACGWGAAAGPIYIVKGSDVKTQVILATSGYSLEVDPAHTNNGLPNLIVTADTAGTNSVTNFEFNSKEYQEKSK